MDGTKRRAGSWFDRRAASYEGGFTSRWRDPLQQASFDALELSADDRLLDVGCGTGWASRTAADIAGSVVGIDLSPGMIAEARGLAAGVPSVGFAIADAEDLPFADGTFTAVLCTNAFHHYPQPERAIREMTRVLATGGRLVLGDACSDRWAARIADSFLRRFEPGHVRLYRSAELGSFAQGADLSKVQLRRVSGGGMAIVRGVRAA
ncbi:MAG TPA: methyltransferase domain-containing protein [Actinomycetota bacterium]|nr:methyltransferase domain-containing protein [Actinomycetota bacterium]